MWIAIFLFSEFEEETATIRDNTTLQQKEQNTQLHKQKHALASS
jgi:hypothetical protein